MFPDRRPSTRRHTRTAPVQQARRRLRPRCDVGGRATPGREASRPVPSSRNGRPSSRRSRAARLASRRTGNPRPDASSDSAGGSVRSLEPSDGGLFRIDPALLPPMCHQGRSRYIGGLGVNQSVSLVPIIRSRMFFVIRWIRGSLRRKSLRGGFWKPGGEDSTTFHQQVPALNTRLPLRPVYNVVA